MGSIETVEQTKRSAAAGRRCLHHRSSSPARLARPWPNKPGRCGVPIDLSASALPPSSRQPSRRPGSRRAFRAKRVTQQRAPPTDRHRSLALERHQGGAQTTAQSDAPGPCRGPCARRCRAFRAGSVQHTGPMLAKSRRRLFQAEGTQDPR